MYTLCLRCRILHFLREKIFYCERARAGAEKDLLIKRLNISKLLKRTALKALTKSMSPSVREIIEP